MICPPPPPQKLVGTCGTFSLAPCALKFPSHLLWWVCTHPFCWEPMASSNLETHDLHFWEVSLNSFADGHLTALALGALHGGGVHLLDWSSHFLLFSHFPCLSAFLCGRLWPLSSDPSVKFVVMCLIPRRGFCSLKVPVFSQVQYLIFPRILMLPLVL